MYCRKCGMQLDDGAKFCGNCGNVIKAPQVAEAPQQQTTPAPPAPPAQPRAKKKSGGRGALIAVIAVLVLVLAVGGGWLAATLISRDDAPQEKPALEQEKPGGQTSDAPEEPEITELPMVTVLSRPQLLNFSVAEAAETVTPSVSAYSAGSGLSNVVNLDQVYLNEDALFLLERNLFVVRPSYWNEFYEQYESNRYNLFPNFVTVDCMMHTYHLYFSLLLNRTEKDYLSADLALLSAMMLEESIAQYNALVGTDWEEAARRNVLFFGVAAGLLSESVSVPEPVAADVTAELERIYEAAGIVTSPTTGEFLDYSQFLPRGYYAGDQVLEQYFRAMMWYGQLNFTQSEDSLNRSALLMTLAMEKDAFGLWEKIYTITTFFAGASDDLSYYEYLPAIETAYGSIPEVSELAEETEAYTLFVELIQAMAPPAINSVPVWEGEAEKAGVTVQELNKGFRFMGQRFTLDAAVMQRLVYSNVKENSAGENRMLPDTLDMPAAMGSEIALELLEEMGATDFAGYSENMAELRTTIANAPESAWNSSLYSSWLYTLAPLLTEKGDGYPSFMTSTEWGKKSLETFAGSFTELKHDTVLYSKQVMAEMGGGGPEPRDDRGYVEPEVEVYRRFMLLAGQTAQGLDGFGVLDDTDRENLARLEELAEKLMVISQKELRNEVLTDEEYELIRAYGGTLEHFWYEAVKDKDESGYADPREIPASLVTDIATDPNGTVLQVATGRPAEILVIVPVDGTLRVASGVVYDFYQFEQPISQRLTDREWRQMIGEWPLDDGSYNRNVELEKPWWTTSYWYGK